MSKIPTLPLNLPQDHRKFLQRVKEILEDTPYAFSGPPGAPSAPRINPVPGGNSITFTGGNGATGHLLYVSPTPTFNPTVPDNHIIDIGQSTLYVHIVGQAAVPRFYWVVATRGITRTLPVGPTKGVTLALGTPAAPTPGTGAQPGNITVNTNTKLPTANLPKLRGGQYYLP